MLPKTAVDMEFVDQMELVNVTTVSMQLIAQVNFLWTIQSSKFVWNKYFAWIVKCDAAQNCSGQGICGPDGVCQCEAMFYGENCKSKLRKLMDN